MEGVNDQSPNAATLHTTEGHYFISDLGANLNVLVSWLGCTMPASRLETGYVFNIGIASYSQIVERLVSWTATTSSTITQVALSNFLPPTATDQISTRTEADGKRGQECKPV